MYRDNRFSILSTQHHFALDRFLQEINGRNAVSGKIAGSCSLVIVEPAPDVKRVDDWALDVAVPVTVKRYENVRKKKERKTAVVCVYTAI